MERVRHEVVEEWFYPKIFGDEPGQSFNAPPESVEKEREIELWLMEPQQATNERRWVRLEADERDGKEGFVVQKVVTFIYPETNLT